MPSKSELLLLPEETTLVIIDHQRDFIKGNGRFAKYYADGKEQVKPYQKLNRRMHKTLDEWRAMEEVRRQLQIVFVQSFYEPDQFKHFSSPITNLCVEGTKGAELTLRVMPENGDRIFIKREHSALSNLEFFPFITQRRNLIIAGLATNRCVAQTIQAALNAEVQNHIANPLNIIVVESLVGARAAQQKAAQTCIDNWKASDSGVIVLPRRKSIRWSRIDGGMLVPLDQAA